MPNTNIQSVVKLICIIIFLLYGFAMPQELAWGLEKKLKSTSYGALVSLRIPAKKELNAPRYLEFILSIHTMDALPKQYLCPEHDCREHLLLSDRGTLDIVFINRLNINPLYLGTGVSGVIRPGIGEEQKENQRDNRPIRNSDPDFNDGNTSGFYFCTGLVYDKYFPFRYDLRIAYRFFPAYKTSKSINMVTASFSVRNNFKLY